MSYLRKFKGELKKIEIPNKESVLDTAFEGENAPKKPKARIKRVALTPLVAIILCIAMVGGVAAAIPAIVDIINARILTNTSGRLDTVPEGYVGIYSASDLDAVRNDLDANYILMSDLNMSGYAFAPISKNGDEVFSGIFNGNGYTVKNLTLDTSAVTDGYFGLFGETDGYFINLCVEGLTLDILLDTPQSDICVGSIAGSATFVGGCYIKDCKIDVSYEDLSENTLYAGGLAGTADYVDSCAVYADLSVNGKGGNVYAALGTAATFSAVTTYTVGKISVSDEGFASLFTDDVALTATDASMPVMLGESAMQKLIARLEAYYGDNRFYINKFESFFVPIDSAASIQYEKLVEANELFGYLYVENLLGGETVYVFDTRARLKDVKMINSELLKIYGSQEEFLKFCAENQIKCGMISCYSFENAESVNAESLAGFDFENIWDNGDRIIPKIFAK